MANSLNSQTFKLDKRGLNGWDRERIPTLSLFSGAGGLDIGFSQAGFDIRGCVEIENAYCNTLQANVGEADGYSSSTKIHTQSILDFDAKPYLEMDIQCVIGGPPCQTFSAAGRRSGGVIGIDDDRGQLFLAYCRVLSEIKPRVFVFENVYGLPGANDGGPWREICKEFAALGYDLKWEVLDAADYGVPQHRERLIMIGTKVGQFRFPLPTNGPDSRDKAPLLSVQEAISDLQDPNEEYHDNLGGLYGHLLHQVPEGLNYSFFTAEMGHPKPVFAWRSKFHDLLYKVDRNAPCRTLKAQPGKFTGPFHWKNRHFTVAELKRLQTIPDGYAIKGGYGKVLEQIGNSVPPRLAFIVATSVREQLFDHSATLTYHVRGEDFRSTFRQRQRSKNSKFQKIAADAMKNANGSAPSVQEKKSAVSNKIYLLNPNNLFDREKIKSSDPAKENAKYSVKVFEFGKHIELELRNCQSSGNRRSVVEISGLNKYLPHYDTLTCISFVENLEDVFHSWATIENELIERSNFFSLIDIYGHYANRGDTVDINSTWSLSIRKSLDKVLNFCGKTVNCGSIYSVSDICDRIGVSERQFGLDCATLREVRFDVRTAATHQILGKERALCTYPFPLLSARALVESRVQFVNLRAAKGDSVLASLA